MKLTPSPGFAFAKSVVPSSALTTCLESQHPLVEMKIGMRSVNHRYMIELSFHFLASGPTSYLYIAFSSSTL